MKFILLHYDSEDQRWTVEDEFDSYDKATKYAPRFASVGDILAVQIKEF